MQQQDVADPELNDTDWTILRALADGRNAPSNIAETAEKSRQYVHQRMKLLETADYIRTIGSGVYELVPEELPDDVRADLDGSDTPERDAASDRSEVSDLLDRLETALTEAETALEQQDRETLADALKTAQGALQDAQEVLDDG